MENTIIYDYIIIGSGFGGSVSALRLIEKGYSVLMIESGKRYHPENFPKTNWNLRKFLWAPAIGLYGILRIQPLKNVLILAGSGVGGGSLVYANTLLVPPDPFFTDPSWISLDKDWKNELIPHYNTAKRMLGVTKNSGMTDADKLLYEYSKEIGRERFFKNTDVGVFFGEPGKKVPDPFFNGEGPERTGCTKTGHCMVGCRDDGKNSLDKNYLWLAENRGLEILPQHKVVSVTQNSNGTYSISAKKVTGIAALHKKKKFISKGIIFSAGALGTNELLLKCKEKKYLKKLSEKVGFSARTNSEVMTGITANRKKGFKVEGVSITSGVYVNDSTHIEVVRYPKGSSAMNFLTTLLVDKTGKVPRFLKLIKDIIIHPLRFLKISIPYRWAELSTILLVMQTTDNKIRLTKKRRLLFPFKKVLTSVTGEKKIPAYIQAANDVAREMAKKIDGTPQSAVTEILFNSPVSAHLIGGCPMGKNAGEGVIDKYHKVFGYENMYVIDGSSIPANLGVNPSLTITAMAERAMSYIPKKTEK